MEPDRKNNYWENDADESEKITSTYAPEPESDSVLEESNSTQPNDELADETDLVHWTAKEYISKDKNSFWYVAFFTVVAAFLALDIFVFKSYTFSVLVIVMAIAVIVYSRRPPRDIEYTLSGQQGLYVGEKLHHFSEFSSFGMIRDGENFSIMLIPIKRFAPGVSVYFPEEVGEKVIDILGSRLPMENLKLDIIDIIVRKLRL